MTRALSTPVLLAVAVMAIASPARAVPTIAVDLDLAAAGIQSRRTVSPGSLFTVGIVYDSDGLSVFDEIGLGVAFNDAGTVLGLGPGVTPGDPRFGELASRATGFVQERDTFDAAFAGAPMHPSGVFTPPVGFADGIGPFGYSVEHPGVFTPGASRATSTVLTVTFEALFAGSSAICPEPFSPFLFLDGAGVEAVQAGAVVTVARDGAPVPEPATLLLLAVGLALAAKHRRVIG